MARGRWSRCDRAAAAERGFTLVETLLTVWLLGAVVLGGAGALFTMVRTSDLNRRTTVAETELRRLVEAARAEPYVSCSTTAARSVAPYTGAYTGGGDTIVVNGDTVTTDPAELIQYWDGTRLGWGAPDLRPEHLWHGCPPGGDRGVQVFSLDLTVKGAPDVTTHRLVVKRRP
jgi:hypothetical protein